jgi:formamidopyrimidine-DNA glycosylase
MPELPEVETIRRDLLGRIVGKKIKKIEIKDQKLIRSRASVFVKSLVDKKFVEIERIGKLLIFSISNNLYLLIHLKMTGQLIYLNKKEIIAGGHSLSESPNWPNKYTRIILEFSDGARLLFNDLRRFGYWQLVNLEELEKIKKNYGPEPANLLFSHWQEILKNKKTNIKAFLLNQKHISGLGNIYVDESLFLAGIRPTRLVSSLNLVEQKKLYLSMKKVIDKAIKYRGTTFRNYMDSEGKKGNFSSFLKVYGRSGEKCRVCQTRIVKIKLAGRGTHYCPLCQS